MVVSLLGCYTSKKAGRDLDKAMAKKPAIAAEKCSTWFPVIEKTDTVTTVELLEVECPPDTVTQIWIDEKHDTIVLTKIGKTKFVKSPAVTKTITITKPDGAKEAVLQSKVDGLERAANKTAIRRKIERAVLFTIAGIGWLLAIIFFLIGRISKKIL